MRAEVGLAATAVALLVAGTTHADESQRYFYKGYDYGSQALQNPIYALVSRGYDTLQLRPQNRSMALSQVDVQNVLGNLADPFRAIRQRGWGKFLREEIFPLSFGQGTARWVPNYTLHLLGGGQTFAWMREWFLDHEAPPALASALSALTTMVAALVNESIENKGVRGFNTDAIADIYVFDLGGIALFSFEGVRRFFSRTVTLSDWSLQPAITLPHGDLHNVGNYYALKIPTVLFPDLRLFAYSGYATIGGLSYRFPHTEYSLSAGAGVRVSNFVNVGGANVVSNEVHFKPSGGVFLDRNESVLASVEISAIPDYSVSANLYPNALFHSDPGVGAFTAVGTDGRWTAGLSFTRAFGIGVGAGTR